MDVYNEMVIAHSRLEEPAYAMAAAAQFEKLITKGLHKRDEAFNRLRYLIGLTTAHLMQGWSAALPQKQKYHFEESEALAAEALFLSDQVNDRSTYINVLCSLTEVVPYYHRHNGLVKFWLTEEDREHFELVDSFLAEAEVLAIQQPHLLLKVLNLRGFLYFMIKRMDKAAEKLKMFAERFIEAYYRLGSSSIGRISYHDIWKSSFRMLQAASLKEMRPFEALIWAERERARDLLHSLTMKKDTENYVEDLMEFDTDDRRALEEIISISTDSIEENTVFLIFTIVTGNRGLCIYLIHKSKISGLYMSFPEPTDMVTLVQGAAKAIRINKNPSTRGNRNLDLLKWWYSILIPEAIENKLEAIKPRKLVIVPGEELSTLPFAALFKEDGGPFLIEKYAISYITSLRMYKQCQVQYKNRKSERRSALVLGNPTEDLPFSEKEAAFVNNVLGGVYKEVTLLQNANATKRATLEALAGSEWVHIAGHAVVSNRFPRGAIPLASEDEDSPAPKLIPATDDTERERRLLDYLEQVAPSSILTGLDIESLEAKLQALVIVLSACTSGLGQLCSEGVLGLYRSLHVTGATSVISSLWNVNEGSTKYLMQELYTNLKNDMDIAFALQKTMTDMIQEMDEDTGTRVYLVKHWAPFMISGYPHVKLV